AAVSASRATAGQFVSLPCVQVRAGIVSAGLTGGERNMHWRAMAGLALKIAAVTPAAAQDAENGEQIYRRCKACHQIGEGARNTVGPQLNDIVGRAAGSVEGYNYSKANRKAAEDGLVWTEENLMEYLENPRSFMRGTKMAFAGLRDEQDRKD